MTGDEDGMLKLLVSHRRPRAARRPRARHGRRRPRAHRPGRDGRRRGRRLPRHARSSTTRRSRRPTRWPRSTPSTGWAEVALGRRRDELRVGARAARVGQPVGVLEADPRPRGCGAAAASRTAQVVKSIPWCSRGRPMRSRSSPPSIAAGGGDGDRRRRLLRLDSARRQRRASPAAASRAGWSASQSPISMSIPRSCSSAASVLPALLDDVERDASGSSVQPPDARRAGARRRRR